MAAAASTGTAALNLHRRHLRGIVSDTEHAFLSSPPAGRPVDVTSADGTRLHVEVFGADDAPTVILAHGWTEALTYWAYQIRDLSRDHRIVAYDLRGHRFSARARTGDYSLARFGDDLEAVLCACVPEGGRAVVAGHSLGAMSIAAWAENHTVETRVGAAALLNTGIGDLIGGHALVTLPRFARWLNEPVARHAFLGAHAPIPSFSTPLHHAAIRYFAFGPTATPAQIAFYEQMLVSCPGDVRAACGIAMSDMELHHALPQLTVPTLVMAGAQDRLTPPSHARRIAGMLPALTELIVLPGTGHMGPLERPHEFSHALRELAARVAVPHGSVAA